MLAFIWTSSTSRICGEKHRSGTKAPSKASQNREMDAQVFVKRPQLSQYDVFRKYKVVNLLAQGLLEEARTMEFLSKHPHPNIVRYHGCRSQRGHLTGIVLDRHLHNLEDYVKNEIEHIEKETFMNALGSAINHLHSLS
ncbi:hypothetical protein PT974_04159 [Cladobotryum mycophilum]|uniref:Protein kinase domain-containing protein n=1 Tax=Cladobotryum mycophilum TaxID=491253 RepID=A0ABR0SUA0_9HYPO